MIVLSHATGNANVRNAALALAGNRLLAEYWTCVDWDPGSPLNHLLPAGLRRQLERRALPEELREFARYSPWREMGRMLAAKLGWEFPCRHERGPFSIDAVFRSLDRRVAHRLKDLPGVTGAYAYEDGASATFEVARERGLARIYDLPIGYWRAAHRIYAEEAAREPEWACTLSGMRDSAEKLARKDREIELASTVIAASTFTRDTIAQASPCTAPIHVIPYGSPSPVCQVRANSRPGTPLRALFVGSLGQRKGLSYLFEAVAQMRGSVTLTLIGRKVVPDCVPLNAAVARHRWLPTLSHQGVLEEMAAHDVLLFPSLFEGFGLVILEAMAQGLPVITTSQTAGPDLIVDGQDGFIVPMRSAAAIAQKLDLLVRDPSLLSAMKVAARESASRRTWGSYQTKLFEAIRTALPE